MALRKHSQLLPSVFQTDRNQKFLNATLDQLNSEPNNVRINQYIGRKSSGSFSKGDSYVTESTARRQNYQLEPAVVYRNSAGEVQSVNGVVNALNSIAFNNADTTNMHKLVSQQYYNYEGWVDIDKLINYGEYFWLPKGPDVVNVGGSAVDPEKDFTVNRSDTNRIVELYDSNPYDSTPFAESFEDISTATSYYTFDSDADQNQTIYLARGGEYTFTVDQPGFPFWIQTEIGISGISSSQSNVSTREVAGVVNNGEDDGAITFRPPRKDDQNFFVNLPVTANVDLATDFTWRELHNQTLQNVLDAGGIDTLTSFENKTYSYSQDRINLYFYDAYDNKSVNDSILFNSSENNFFLSFKDKTFGKLNVDLYHHNWNYSIEPNEYEKDTILSNEIKASQIATQVRWEKEIFGITSQAMAYQSLKNKYSTQALRVNLSRNIFKDIIIGASYNYRSQPLNFNFYLSQSDFREYNWENSSLENQNFKTQSRIQYETFRNV